jgi:hypothetical protein
MPAGGAHKDTCAKPPCWQLLFLFLILYRRVPYNVFFDGITTLFLPQDHGSFVKITESSSPKFSTEKTISLNSEIHADLMLYSDSAQFSKVFGLFQISYHYFCVEIFLSKVPKCQNCSTQW